MYLRWVRRPLKTNRQRGEILCPHEEVVRPCLISPHIVHDGVMVWSPGPTIRECCIERGRGLAIAAWWWEVKNRFEDLSKVGLDNQEHTEALLEQVEYIESLLEEVVPKPTKEDWRRYIEYREDTGQTERRIRKTPACIKYLGLPWPCSKEALDTRWKEIALRTHPDHGGQVAEFRTYLAAYKRARVIFERLSA